MIGLILTLALVGFILYLITQYIPMPTPIKQGIIVIVVIVLIIYLMGQFGILDIPIPRVR